ncbi:MAG: response regulator [Planctomycetota bacterium]
MSKQRRILVVDDSPTQLALMKALLSVDLYEIVAVASGEAALAEFEKQSFDVVVTDVQMSGMSGLELVGAIKRLSPRTPVILATSQERDGLAAEALFKGATTYVPKAQMQEGLAETVRQVIGLAESMKSHNGLCDCVSHVQLELTLPSNPSLVPGLIGRFETAMQEIGLFDEMAWTQIAMALDEAIVNAMVHGNLEVSSALREVDEGKAYIEAIETRQKESPYQDRRVVVSVTASRVQAVFIVRDEGNGFDVTSLPDPTDPENLENMGGRGLLLINAFMDVVKHNDKGNQVTMIKKKEAVREEAVSD